MRSPGLRLITALAVFTTYSAIAADSVEVKVIGTIVPAACTPSIVGGATIDYGTIKSSTLTADNYTLLPVKHLDLAITCDAPAKVALSLMDIKRDSGTALAGLTLLDSSALSTQLGLGQQNGKNIGAYAISLTRDALYVDGQNADTISAASTLKWSVIADRLYFRDTDNLVSFSQKGATTPMAFTTLNASLEVQAAINKGSELDLTRPIHLDGMSTIELHYL